MRIHADHGCTPIATNRTHVASSQTDNGFADALASAVESGDGETDSDGPAPELSAATYRLFAAIDLERGDTKHADLHLSRVADAREAGLPLHPTGLLSDVGRWDYTEAAAALPETGRFDTASGQGEATFIPYNATGKATSAGDCDPAETAAVDAATETALDRLRAAVAASPGRNADATRLALREIADLIES
jgi:hypothetical protein